MTNDFGTPRRGDFRRWDPKITTLPGLYLASSALRAPLLAVLGAAQGASSSSSSKEALCGAVELRAINLAFGAGTAAISARILGRLFPAATPLPILLRSLAVLLFPLHFFYIGMYYTDPACLFAILFMYERVLARDAVGSAILGGASVVMRQTSIVWVVFCAGVGVLKVVESSEDGGGWGRGKGGSSRGGKGTRTSKKTDEACGDGEGDDADVGAAGYDHDDDDDDAGEEVRALVGRAISALRLASGWISL